MLQAVSQLPTQKLPFAPLMFTRLKGDARHKAAMRVSVFLLLIVLAACSRSDAAPLTQSDWTNGQKPCSENHLSFRDGRIAYHPRGSRPLVMFEIVSMDTDAADHTLTEVITKPTGPVRQEAERQGLAVPLDYVGMMLFRVVNGRLSLVEVANGDGSNRHPASVVGRRNFELLRCH